MLQQQSEKVSGFRICYKITYGNGKPLNPNSMIDFAFIAASSLSEAIQKLEDEWTWFNVEVIGTPQPYDVSKEDYELN